MVFLWGSLAWSAVAMAAGVWLGTAMQIAGRNDAVREDVDAFLRRELARL